MDLKELRLWGGSAVVQNTVPALGKMALEAADEIERLRGMLQKIAEYPHIPEIVRQYAAGRLDGTNEQNGDGK